MTTRIFPRNLTARAAVQIVGNPVTTRLESGVGNCFPGLEFDHRNLDRRFFPGLIINFGVLPLTFSDPAIFDRLEIGDVVEIAGIEAGLSSGQTVTANINGKPLALRHGLSARQIDLVLRGGIINWLRERVGSGTPDSSASKVA